ncbi:hypothetical protein EPN83_00515 [Patescibacteria group bacterium]|nr:MAG: hypothetical protein EPN83_00515 [Patescibacteria group bacterium]
MFYTLPAVTKSQIAWYIKTFVGLSDVEKAVLRDHHNIPQEDEALPKGYGRGTFLYTATLADLWRRGFLYAPHPQPLKTGTPARSP